MATFKLATGSDKAVWSSKYLESYFRTSGYEPYMGTTEGAIVRVKKDLMSQAGSTLNFPMIMNLKGAGVTGSTRLKGAEENLGNYNDQIKINYKRNAVLINKDQTFRTEIDVFNAARAQLVNWGAGDVRDNINLQLQSVIVSGTPDVDGFFQDTAVAYATATAGNRNAWLVRNRDRIYSTGGVGAETVFANVVTAVGTNKLTAAKLSAAKRLAQRTTKTTPQVGPAITPFKNDATAGREWFVLFVDSNGFRDLHNDASIIAANTDARVRSVETNPIFQGGDLIYDGVIIREIVELEKIATNVGMAALCGVNAVGIALGQNPTPVRDVDDYGFETGVGIELLRGYKKLSFNGVQSGLVNVLHESADDIV